MKISVIRAKKCLQGKKKESKGLVARLPLVIKVAVLLSIHPSISAVLSFGVSAFRHVGPVRSSVTGMVEEL